MQYGLAEEESAGTMCAAPLHANGVGGILQPAQMVSEVFLQIRRPASCLERQEVLGNHP